MFNLLHVVLSCLPWAAWAARPTMQLDHVILQRTPAVEELRYELRKYCQESTVEDYGPVLTKLEEALHSSAEALSILAEVFNCTGHGHMDLRRTVAKKPLIIALSMYTDEAIPLLEKPLSDDYSSVRREAVIALTSVPKFNNNISELMMKTLKNDDNNANRGLVATALVQAANDLGKYATRLIKQALRDQDEHVRERGVRALDVLFRQPGVNIASFARKAMYDEQDRVRQVFAGSPFGAAVDTIGEKASDICEKLMGDRNTDVRNTAAETLAAKIKNNSKDGLAIFQHAIGISCDHHHEAPVHTNGRGPECPAAATAAGEPLAAVVQMLGGGASTFLSSALKREEPGVRAMAAGKPLLLFLKIMNMTFEEANKWTMPSLNDTYEAVREASASTALWVSKLKVEEQADEIAAEKEEVEKARVLADKWAARATNKARLAEKETKAAQYALKQTQDALQEVMVERMKATVSEEQRVSTQKALSKQEAEVREKRIEMAVKAANMQADMDTAVRKAVSKEKEEVNETFFQLRLKEMYLNNQTRAYKEALDNQREEKKWFMNLAVGAFISVMVAILPLLAKWFVAWFGAAPKGVTSERAEGTEPTVREQ